MVNARPCNSRVVVVYTLQDKGDDVRDLVEVGGFVDKIISAEGQASVAVEVAGLVGQHGDDDGGVFFLDGAKEVDAAGVGEIDIEEDECRGLDIKELEGL